VRLLLIVSLLFSAGCATSTFRYQRVGKSTVLLPPSVRGNPQPGTLTVKVAGARCEVTTPSIALSRSGKLSVKFDDVESLERIPVSLMDDVETFRAQVLDRCSNGETTLRRISSEAPLPPLIALYLRHGNYPFTGFIDLVPPLQIKAVVPRPSTGIPGFDTYFYPVEPVQGSANYRLPPDAARLGFDQAPARLRLLFLTRLSSVEHDAIILSAATPQLLREATPKVQQAPDDYCRHPLPGTSCILIPKHHGFSAEVAVQVNGKPAVVPLAGTIREALRIGGLKDPATAIGTLQITKSYRGRKVPIEFDRQTPAILSFVLSGDEELRWTQ
jgi:hypothetical protein